MSACCSGQLGAHGRIFDDIEWQGREDLIPREMWQELHRLLKRQEEAWIAGEHLSSKECQFDWDDGYFELIWPTERGPTVLQLTNVWFYEVSSMLISPRHIR